MLVAAFKHIAVVGLGLIGGSLVKSFRRTMPGSKLIGIDFQNVVDAARHELDDAFLPHEMARALRDVDLVFLATPISRILSLLPAVAAAIRPGAIVTDVGSTKSAIVAEAQKYFTGTRYFIGGHPMAGREKGGWENADAGLFENAAYVLTPSPNFPAPLVEDLSLFLQTIGARVMILDAATHDRGVADLSHLPQLLAVALMNFATRKDDSAELRLPLSGSGFRDMTRLAASPFGVWQDIFDSNKANVRESLQEFIATLQNLARDLEHKNLERSFTQANRLRELISLRR